MVKEATKTNKNSNKEAPATMTKNLPISKIEHKTLIKKATTKMTKKIAAMRIWKNNNLQEKNALTSFVILKKFIRNSVQRFNMQNTDSFAVNVTIVITITIFVNFVNKYTQVRLILMMTINGLDATLVVDG